MKINLNKTKLMLFNTCKSLDFEPNINLENCLIELVEEAKILGVIIQSDLKWNKNTEYMVRRASKKLWILRRLKNLGAHQKILVDMYEKHVRSILELAVPLWHSSITEAEKQDIERVQKCALKIILGDKYISYKNALASTQLETLDVRRNHLCLTFALKAEKSEKFEKWFKGKPAGITRRNDKYFPTYARTERLLRSPISYLTKILNEHYSK